MRIEYFHASKFGNGAMVAEEFKAQMAAKGVTVNVQHIREVRSDRLPPAGPSRQTEARQLVTGSRRKYRTLTIPPERSCYVDVATSRGAT